MRNEKKSDQGFICSRNKEIDEILIAEYLKIYTKKAMTHHSFLSSTN